jgi:hypothetical protein
MEYTANLEAKLLEEITQMMAGQFGDMPNDVGIANAVAVRDMGKGIAKKLADAARANNAELNAEIWQQMAHDATRGAIFKFGEETAIGENPSFVEEIARCTTVTVAPPTSTWNRTAMEESEKVQLKGFKFYRVPKKNIDEALASWRDNWVKRSCCVG